MRRTLFLIFENAFWLKLLRDSATAAVRAWSLASCGKDYRPY